MKKIVCLVPLRGGSESIYLKNIKMLNGKPLCFWAMKAASMSGLFSKIYVSTESVEIMKAVEGLGIENVEIVRRPDILALNTSTTEEVMLHLMGLKEFDILFTVQVTSPMTRPEDFVSAYKVFIEGNYDSLFTGIETKRFYWTKQGTPLNYDYMKRPRRQDFEGSVLENGAFFITKREILKNCGNRLGGKIGIYIMPEYNAIEIDEPDDWIAIERIMANKNIVLNGD
jgi:N-acylneuraminate cytidylyltransferase